MDIGGGGGAGESLILVKMSIFFCFGLDFCVRRKIIGLRSFLLVIRLIVPVQYCRFSFRVIERGCNFEMVITRVVEYVGIVCS